MAYDETTSAEEIDPSTRVDLGEDLLSEKTKVIHRGEEAQGFSEALSESPEQISGSPDDLLQSAKILMNEGLLDDAKKTLRKVLLIDSSNAIARQTLEDIYALELKKIFTVQEIPYSYLKKIQPSLTEVDTEALIMKLDEDFRLGIYSDDNGWGGQSVISGLRKPEVVESLSNHLDQILSTGKTQDWIDLGIAFLEMNLYEVAIHLFSTACQTLDTEGDQSSGFYLSANSLLGYTLTLAGRPFEAISQIQPILQDIEIKREDKIDFFYLMGRIYESINKLETSLHFYRQAAVIDPIYRDLEQRLRKKG